MFPHFRSVRQIIRSWFTARQQRPIRRRDSRVRLRPETLEDRLAPATFTVTNLLDDGSVGSFRWALTQANSTSGASTIDFNTFASTGPGLQVITLTGGALPNILNPLTIDGTSQPGYVGTPLIDINADSLSGNIFNVSNGSATPVTFEGLKISGYQNTAISLYNAAGSVLQNLDLSNAQGNYPQTGIDVNSSDNITIQNVNASGTVNGIEVQNSANPIIQNNTLEYTGTNIAALYLDNVTGLTTGAISGNNYGYSNVALRIDNGQQGLTIGNASTPGAQIVIENGASGMSTVYGFGVYLNNSQPALISNLQLGYAGPSQSGNGLYVNGTGAGSGLIIQNVTATNRGTGVYFGNPGALATVTGNNLSNDSNGLQLINGADLTVTNNTLTNDGNCAMYLDSFTANTHTFPVNSSGNIVTGSNNGFQLWNLGTLTAPETIGTSGTGIVISNANDGFQTASGNALWLRNDPNVGTIQGLNLSWTGSSAHTGAGIYSDGTIGDNLVIQNDTINNRSIAINLQYLGADALITNNNFSNNNGGISLYTGTDLTVTNNNLTNDSSYALSVNNFTAVSQTWPIIANTNNVAGSGDGIDLANIGLSGNPETIGVTPGSYGIVINNTNDGFQTTSGSALNLNNVPDVGTINGLNLSWTGSASHSGYGINATTIGGNLVLENITATNRSQGIDVNGPGAGALITTNTLSNDGTPLTLMNGTDLTVTGNNLTYSTSVAMYLDTFSASNQTDPVIASNNSVTGSSGYGFQLFNLGTSAAPETISKSGSGIVISNSDGFQTVGFIALYLRNLPNATISNVNLSWTGEPTGNYGIYQDGGLGGAVTISDVTANNRSYGIYLQNAGADAVLSNNTLTNDSQYGLNINNATDLTVNNNNLSSDGIAMYFNSINASSQTYPVDASGNIVAGSSIGLYLANTASQSISTSGSGIVINNATDGFQTVSNIPLYIVNLPNATISNVDLSWSGSGRSGSGIQDAGYIGAGVTISNVNASNRGNGFYFDSGGQDLTLNNNTLNNDNQSLYANGFTASGTGLFTTVPIIGTSNSVANSSNGFFLYAMTNVLVGTSGTGLIVNNATDGFQTVTGEALRLEDMPGATISGLNLSYGGSGHPGYGIFSQYGMGAGVTITNVAAANRNQGIIVTDGYYYTNISATITNNNLSNDSGDGIYLEGRTSSGNNSTGLTVNNNNLANDGTAMYLSDFSATGTAPFTVPVVASGNTVAGSTNGFNLNNLTGQTIGASSAGILIDNATDGFQTVRGTALYVNSSNVTVTGLDLSWTGSYSDNALANNSYGINASGSSVAISQVIAAGRTYGVALSGSTLSIQNSSFSNDYQGVTVSDGTDTALVNQNYIVGNTTGLVVQGGSVQVNATANYWGPGGGAGAGGNNGFTGSADVSSPLASPPAGAPAIPVKFVVNTTTDDDDAGTPSSIYALTANPGADGTISLREAILAANATPGPSVITFAIPGGGAQTITLGAALPAITGTLTIDGTSEPGYANVPLITIDDNGLNNTALTVSGTGDVLEALNIINAPTTAVTIVSATNAFLKQMTLSDGGGSGTGLIVNSSSNVLAQDLTINDRTTGIDLAPASQNITVVTSIITNNTTGVEVSATPTGVALNQDEFQGNSTAVVNGGPLVDATNSYWGASNGPTNLGGSGNGYTGNVNASPFLTAVPQGITASAPPPATVTVNTTADVVDGNTSSIAALLANPGPDSKISLREAITAINASGGGTIDFAIGTGAQTITLNSALGVLPTITVPITIDGTTQTGYAGSPLITINANGVGGSIFHLTTASGDVLKNFNVTNYSNNAVYVNGAANASVLSLNLTNSGGIGVYVDGSANNVVIQNVIATGASNGIRIDGSSNPTVQNNTLNNDGTALYLNADTGLAVGAVSGNTYSGSNTGLEITSGQSGLIIGDAMTANAQIIIEDRTSGMSTVTGTALFLDGSQPALLIDRLQLGYSGPTRSGYGIYSDYQNVGTGLTIQNVTATNRNYGIFFPGGGQDLTLTGNNLDNDNTSLYLDSFTVGTHAQPVIASGNTVAGSNDGFDLYDLGAGETIGTSGGGIVIDNNLDGFHTVVGNALRLRNTPGITITNLDLSWTGSGAKIGTGIYSDGYLGGNVTIENVTVTNRGSGVYLESGIGADGLFTGNNLSNNTNGLYLTNGTDLTVANNNLDNNSNFAMQLNGFTAVSNTYPVLSYGNTVAGSGDGFDLYNLGTTTNPETIGLAAVGGPYNYGININNANDGFGTASGDALYLNNVPNVGTINGLNLSWTGLGSASNNSYGINATNIGGSLVLSNITATNRTYGISVNGLGAGALVTSNILSNDGQGLTLSNGSNLTVTGNTLTDDTGWALTLSSFTTTTAAEAVISSSNNATGSSYGFQLNAIGSTTTPETIGTSGNGIIIVPADGFQTVVNQALNLANLPDATISNVNLSWTGSTSQTGYGIVGGSLTGVTISNITASNRFDAIQVTSGQNLTLTSNTLTQNTIAVYLDSITASGAAPFTTTPVIASGNVVTDSGTGFQLFSMTGLFVGASGTGIIVSNSDGLRTNYNYSLYIRNLPNSTIDGLDLSYIGSGTTTGYTGVPQTGSGILSDSNLGAGLTISNIIANNRTNGIYLYGGGQNLTLTGNNLDNDGTSLYLDGFSASGAAPFTTTPVVGSGNTVAGSTNGFQLRDMNGLFVGTSGTGLIVNNATDGFQTVTNDALYIYNLPNSTISGLDLSYSGAVQSGYGIINPNFYFSGSNLTITNVNASNRAGGISLGGYGNSNLTLTNNTLNNDGTSIYLQYFFGPTPLTGSGNTFAGSNTALSLQNFQSGVVLGNSIAPGVNFIIDSNSGLDSVYGTAISLYNDDNFTIDGVDVSYRDLTRSGSGIADYYDPGNGLIVKNVTAMNRQTGLSLGQWGNNGSITNSNFINNDTGIQINTYYGGSVNNNDIAANGTGIAYTAYSANTLDATGNYWGPGSGGAGSNGNNGYTTNYLVDASGFVNIVPTALDRDYGTDPSAFGFSTALIQFGARSIVSGPYFGTTTPTATADGSASTVVATPNLAANGIAISTLVPGQMATATVFVSGAPSGAYVDAWIDFKEDGTWTDAGDQIAVSVPVVNGSNTINFPVPAGASVSLNYIRFRISSAGGLKPYGESVDGAVQDLLLYSTIYVDKDWAAFTNGTAIADADPVKAGDQNAIFGVNAFATISAGIAAASANGTVIVNAGTTGTPGDYSGETVSINKSGLTVVLQQGNITVGSMADTVSNDTLDLSGVSLTTGGNNSSTAFGGVITGSGSLTKTGSGTMTLTNNETYTGNTTVSAGGLALADGANSDNIAGSPTITVAASASLDVSGLQATTLALASGQTLQGAGSVTGGAVSAASGATIAPGIASPASTGILSTGPVSFSSGSTFSAVINGSVAGASFDQLASSGAVSLGNGVATLSLSGSIASPAGAIHLITATSVSGYFSGYPTGSTVIVNGLNYTISYPTGSVLLTPAVVPTYAVSLTSPGGVLTITQAHAGNDALTFALSGGIYNFTDTGGLIFAIPTGNGAAFVSGGATSTITIPCADVTSIAVTLGTGTNTFTLTGTSAAAAPLNVNTGSTAGDQVSITGAVSDSGAITLTSNAIAINVGSVSTTTTQEYDGAATIGAATTLTGSLVTFDSTLNDGNAAGADALTVMGCAVFDGIVGATALKSICVTGAADLNGASVTTTNNQAYGGAVTLTAPTVTLTSTAGNIHFSSTVDSDAVAPRNLVLAAAGNINADSTVGSGHPLGCLTISTAVSATFSNSITTTTASSHTGNVVQTTGTGTTTLSGGSIAGKLDLKTVNITLNNPLTVAGIVNLTASGNGYLNGTVAAGTIAVPTTITLAGGGTFVMGATNDFSNNTNPVVIAGNSTLNFQNGSNNYSQTFGSLASSVTGAPLNSQLLKLGSAMLTTGNGVNTEFDGVISGTGGLTKQGADNFTLGNANTYSGATNVNNGTLTVGVTNALGSSTSVTVAGATSTLALGTFNDTVAGVTLVSGCITGIGSAFGAGSPTGTLTSATTFAVQSGSISADLAGAASVGLTKTTAGTVILSGPDESYGGTTTLSAGTLTIAATAVLTNSTTTVAMSGPGVTLNGTGTVKRPVVVSSMGDTIGTAGAGNGLTITTTAGIGVTVNSTASVSILGNVIQTGPGYNNTAIDVNGGKALIQDDNLSVVGALQGGTFTSTTLPTVSNPYYGILAVGGAIVDAGQVGGTNFTGLGISTGNDTLAGYQNYTGTTPPNTLSKQVAQAILDDNTNSPNSKAGPQGPPADLYAQNGHFGITITNSNYSALELMVFGDTDASLYGFVNYVTPASATAALVTTQFYSVSPSELTSNPYQRSMIRRLDVAFNNFVTIAAGAFTLNMTGAAATYASSWIGTGGNPSTNVAMTATQLLFDPSTGQFRYEYAFATGQNGVESSGSLTDGTYQLGYNTSLIAGTNGLNPTVPATNALNSAHTTRFTQGAPYSGSGNNYTLNFHRLFGDLDGMGYIDAYDINSMATALGHISGQAAYNADLDYNADGSIDTTTDNPQFTKRKNYYTGANSSLYIGWGWDV